MNVAAEIPTLSLAERDRRWARLRDLLREHDLNGVLIAGFRSREMYECYVADDYNEGCVVFPLDGDPVIVTWAQLRVMRMKYSEELGHPLWVEDVRIASSGAQAADVVREKRLNQGRLGEFSHMMLVKSAEELAQMRYAARAAEAACRVIADIAAPGVGEEVIFAEATREMLRFGIGLRYPMIVLNSGPHTLSWGPPRWTTRAEPPRILARGDLVQAELMPLCGNQEVQVQMTVSLDPMSETNRICEGVARECYAAGVRAMRPGLAFADLVAAMEQPLKESKCWSYTPLVHSLGPHFLMGLSTVNTEGIDLGIRFVAPPTTRKRTAILQPGMVFAFEPNACLGTHRVNIGGTVIVTETGCEELNRLPTEVTHKQ